MVCLLPGQTLNGKRPWRLNREDRDCGPASSSPTGGLPVAVDLGGKKEKIAPGAARSMAAREGTATPMHPYSVPMHHIPQDAEHVV